MILNWIDWSAVADFIIGGNGGYWLAMGKIWLDDRLDEQAETTEQTYLEVREMNEYVHEQYGDEVEHIGPPPPPGRRKAPRQETDDSRFRQWAIGVVVGLTALSAIYFSQLAHQRLEEVQRQQHALDAEQAQFAKRVACQAELLSTTINALKARSAFAEQQATVSLAGDMSQRRFLLAVLDKTSTDDSLRTYLSALRRKIVATRDQLKIRIDNPYPTSEEVIKCQQISQR